MPHVGIFYSIGSTLFVSEMCVKFPFIPLNDRRREETWAVAWGVKCAGVIEGWRLRLEWAGVSRAVPAGAQSWLQAPNGGKLDRSFTTAFAGQRPSVPTTGLRSATRNNRRAFWPRS